MTTVRVETTSCTADIYVNDDIVLTTSLDLKGGIMLELTELIELLEEASDNVVAVTTQEE